ncbi:MAG: hypothetical protein AAGI48_05585 [Verrucomicrobiota bacterium]
MIRPFAAIGVIALLVSCTPTTPEARIEQSPTKFWKLSDEDQRLVRQGQIRRGMNSDAVYYAWGRPSRQFSGADEESSTMRWDYAGSTPVYSSNIYGSYGYGYRRYGRYGRYPYYGYAVSPQVTYVPYRKATVWFRDDRVTKWERSR